jgi:hypothetical protein
MMSKGVPAQIRDISQKFIYQPNRRGILGRVLKQTANDTATKSVASRFSTKALQFMENEFD